MCGNLYRSSGVVGPNRHNKLTLYEEVEYDLYLSVRTCFALPVNDDWFVISSIKRLLEYRI